MSKVRVAAMRDWPPWERPAGSYVLAGDDVQLLRDLVGVVPSVPLLGYMPGSLFASPGTAVRAAVAWVTPAQVEQLAWSEMTYRLGRLEDARFEAHEADLEIDDVFAFVARLGAFCVSRSRRP